MTSQASNTGTPSTTYVWKHVKLRSSAPRASTAAKGARRWSGLSRRDMKAPLTVTVTYRGGAQGWWLVQARGRSGVFPGDRAIIDIMREINRDW